MKAYLILTTAIFVFFLQPSEAIKCYSCNATDSCDDPFKATGNSQCDGTYCMKAANSLIGIPWVFRGCVTNGTATVTIGCQNNVDAIGIKSTTCYCSTENCNGSDGFKYTPVFLIGMSVTCYLARYALI